MTVNLKAPAPASVLDPVAHARIIADVDAVVKRAGIPKAALSQSATDVCCGPELEWLRDYRKNAAAVRGLVLHGQPAAGGPGPERKMIAICAALVRNYVDAQVRSLNAIVDGMEAGERPDCTVLLIPNLFVKQGAKTLPSWQMQKVYDLLLDRLTSSQITCCYVESLDALGAEYGMNFSQHLRDSYEVRQA